MQISTVFNFLAIAVACVAAREPPSICMLSPITTVTAGQSITATLENIQGRPCEATLMFADRNFLPVTFAFLSVACLGLQQAELLVPREVPNGDVTIIWECAGDGARSCSRASIEQGFADVNKLVRQQTGTVKCIVPITTLTTLTTSLRATTTIVDAIVETDFSTSIVLGPSIKGNRITNKSSSTTTPVKAVAGSGTPSLTLPAVAASTEDRAINNTWTMASNPESDRTMRTTTMTVAMPTSAALLEDQPVGLSTRQANPSAQNSTMSGGTVQSSCG